MGVNFHIKIAWNLVQLEGSDAIIVRKWDILLNIANLHQSLKEKFEASQTTKRISMNRTMNITVNTSSGNHPETQVHSKNVRVKISGSFENDPIWVKCASFNPFSGYTRVNFRRKCLTRNSGSKEKARWRCMKRAGNRPRCISSKLFTVCELGLQTWSEKDWYIAALFTSRNLGGRNGSRMVICEASDPGSNNGQNNIKCRSWEL